MHMKLAEILPKLLLLLWTNVLEILATEDHDSTFCDEQSELVSLLSGKLAQLKTFDFRANTGS